MRIINRCTLRRDEHDAEVTLAARRSLVRGRLTYHVYQRQDGVLTFHRSYVDGDVIGWPGERRPGRYTCPEPGTAALEDFHVTVNALLVEGCCDPILPRLAVRHPIVRSEPLSLSA